MKPTAKQIDDHFEAARKICHVLLPVTERAQRRVLAYFMDLIEEGADMEREEAILRTIAQELGVKL